MHSCPVKVILLPLQPLENVILQCLFIWVMVSSQAVLKMNKWGESQCKVGTAGWMQQDCSSKLSDGLNSADTSMAWRFYRVAIILTFFLWIAQQR
jgi:hypothetical protein